MNTKNNQRSKETRKKICRVFSALLGEKPLAKITVQEICLTAKINRTTFYAHYSDVYHLLESIKQEMAVHIQAIFFDADNASGWGLPDNCFENLFEYLLANIDFYRACMQNVGTQNVLDFSLFVSYENQLQPLVRRAGIRTELEFTYLTEYFMGGLNAMIRHWVNTGCRETPRQLANFFMREYKNTVDI